MKLKHALLAAVLAASCGKTETVTETVTEDPGGYVIRVQLDDGLAPSDVEGIEVVISKEGGFPTFAPTEAGDVSVTSSDTNGDSENEVVLVWPPDFEFAQIQYVRLVFDNTAAMSIEVEGTATNASDSLLARGSEAATVPAGGEGVLDLMLSCVAAGCAAVSPDGGADMGMPDAGVDAGPDMGVDAAPDMGVDAGPDMGVDAGPDMGADMIMPDMPGSDAAQTLAGETVPAAGRSTAGSLQLDHEVSHVGTGKSNAGSLEMESVLTITR